jgi:hypothetical protein
MRTLNSVSLQLGLDRAYRRDLHWDSFLFLQFNSPAHRRKLSTCSAAHKKSVVVGAKDATAGGGGEGGGGGGGEKGGECWQTFILEDRAVHAEY